MPNPAFSNVSAPNVARNSRERGAPAKASAATSAPSTVSSPSSVVAVPPEGHGVTENAGGRAASKSSRARASRTEPGATTSVIVPGVPARKSAWVSSVTAPVAAAAVDGTTARAATTMARTARCKVSSVLFGLLGIRWRHSGAVTEQRAAGHRASFDGYRTFVEVRLAPPGGSPAPRDASQPSQRAAAVVKRFSTR